MAARLDQSFTLFGKKIDKSGKNRVATEQIFSPNLSLHPSYHRTEISRYHFVIDNTLRNTYPDYGITRVPETGH
jgi:hypothetical protein